MTRARPGRKGDDFGATDSRKPRIVLRRPV